MFPFVWIAALVPAACVLWFMSQALRNERLAGRERMRELSRIQLELARTRVETFWTERFERLAHLDPTQPAPRLFERAVVEGLADALVVRDPTGEIAYPDLLPRRPAAPPLDLLPQPSTAEAEHLDPLARAVEFSRIAARARGGGLTHAEARALRDQARCLGKGGRREEAIRVLSSLVAEPRFRLATDDSGNLINYDAILLLLRWFHETESERMKPLLSDLGTRLRDYGDASLPGRQRLFLMHEFRQLAPDSPDFPTREAEVLAASHLESQPSSRPGAGLVPSPLPGVWEWTTADGRLTGLFRESNLVASTSAFVTREFAAASLTFRPIPPGDPGPDLPAEHIVRLRAGLPQWQLALAPAPSTPPPSVLGSRLFWTGGAAVLVLGMVAWATGRAVNRELVSTRLKNDLLSTVSHELKTPLASIRALVDTLRSGRYRDPAQLADYLALISRENQRLSHLIDNFLSFNRLERGTQPLRRETLVPAELADAAIAVVRPRLYAAQAHFELTVASALPPIQGDPDALLTALVNLLDNAIKYTGTEKRIAFRLSAMPGQVTFEVEDNGIGIAAAEIPRVFERFYRAENGAAQGQSGCGLGLGIVRGIAHAHHGEVELVSTPGRGTTFRLHLPSLPV